MRSGAFKFRHKLVGWYRLHRRDLPWRAPAGARPPAYHVLLSEFMLQQTQVATVIPYFHRFLELFPTVRSLADADEQAVLRAWQGLGYYSRARNLHAAAKAIVQDHNAEVPRETEQLLALPGVGRYTAGAVRSIAFDRPAAILDGNVFRVLCRIDAIQQPDSPALRNRLWPRAEQLLPRTGVGDFNSALMELGATVCTPRNPRCDVCPVAAHCSALAQKLQHRIPLPKCAPATPLVRRQVLCLRHGTRWLIEQRPASGRWASMWQFITRPTRSAVDLGISLPPLRRLARLTHALTHRRYHFTVSTGDLNGDGGRLTGPGRAWVTLDELADYPLPRPHVRVASLLRETLG